MTSILVSLRPFPTSAPNTLRRTALRSSCAFLCFAMSACTVSPGPDDGSTQVINGAMAGAQSTVPGGSGNTSVGTGAGMSGTTSTPPSGGTAGTATGAGGMGAPTGLPIALGGMGGMGTVTGVGGVSVGLAGGGGTMAGAAGESAGGGGVSAGGGGAGGGGSGSVVDDVCPYTAGTEPDGSNWVNGDMQVYNDNGGWCWYQDERVIVDAEAGKMIIASVASGGSRDANMEIVHWDIAGNSGERHSLRKMAYADDHDVAALIKRPDGGYAAMWAGHNDACESYYSVYDGSGWSNTATFNWTTGCPTSSGKSITYANMWYLGSELISYVRSIDTSPHYLSSSNDGDSWSLVGRLTSTPQVGYVAGYYKYWGNNTDRIDFFGTEAHPRDEDNSLYHGYIEGGQIHKSTGEVVDQDFTDRDAQNVDSYTQVFATGTTINGVELEHMWNADLVRYDDGTVAAIGSGRVTGTGSDDPDKRLLYFRFDGTEWKTTYLARAGTKLYSSEQDYTGLGALHPDNPHVIYISTSYDPRTDEGSFTGKKEIWKGVTCDDGATFDWEPVTANSSMDNLRPVVPKWDANHTALLWLRGSYSTAQSYSQQVVGFIEEH